MSGAFDKDNWSKARCILEASSGNPIPEHLRERYGFTFSTEGRSVEAVKDDLKESNLPQKLRWARPWYRLGGSKDSARMHGDPGGRTPRFGRDSITRSIDAEQRRADAAAEILRWREIRSRRI